MKIKRIFAYILDFMIVAIISALIYSLPMFERESEKYVESYNEYIELLATTGSTEPTIDEINDKTYEFMYYSKNLLIVQAVTTFAYFGVLSYLMKGQTLGKKALHIKIVSDDNGIPNANLFILRSIILTNLIPKIASILSIYLLPKSTYFQVSTPIDYISMIITFTLIGVMIFRDDERSLHDIICKTKVISTKTE